MPSLARPSHRPVERHDGTLLSERALEGAGYRARWRTWHLEGRCEFEGYRSEHRLVLNLGSRARFAQARFEGRAPESCVIRPGQVSLFPAHWRASGHTVGEGIESVLILDIEPGMIARASGGEIEPESVGLLPSLDLRNPSVAQAMAGLRQEVEHGGVMGRVYAESLSFIVLTELVRHHSRRAGWPRGAGSLTPRRLRCVTEYLDAHLADDISIASLAATAGMSPVHFARQFKRVTGLSPHQFVLRRRVERAAGLLGSADMSIAEVALAVGFSSQSHLTATLRRVYGTTPKAYRLKVGA